MRREVRLSIDSRQRILKGIDTLADSVRVTMGPKGRNVMLEREFGSPLITNDGATVAREIELEDKFENMGVELLNQISTKTNDEVGDGTSTSILLSQEIIHQGLKAVDEGYNPVFLKEGMEIAKRAVCDELKRRSIKADDKESMTHIATVSTGSKELGSLIGEALAKAGKYAYIDIDESKSFNTYIEYKEGMHYSVGYISPEMISDPKTMSAELIDPLILITDQKINTLVDIINILEKIVDNKRPLLIMAEDISADVLTTILLNNKDKNFNVVAVKLPYHQSKRENELEDLAVFTGTRVFKASLNQRLQDVRVEDLGSAAKVVVNKDFSTIIGGKGDKKEIDERIKKIEYDLSNTKESFGTGVLRERLGFLTNSVAVIKIGGQSESEFKEKHLRVEDAIHATRAARAEGIVAGGGLTLVEIYKALKGKLKDEDKDVQKGIDIILDCLLKPLKQVSENAGYDGDKIVLEQLSKEDDVGFNCKNGVWCNLLEEGIVDPSKVIRVAFSSAVSLSSLFITSEAAVATLD